MKRIIAIWLTLLMLCCSAGASAEVETELAFVPQNCTFSLELTGLYAGNHYLIMATRAEGTPQEALWAKDMVVMDALAADENGALKLAYTGVNLLDADFYVGGLFAEEDSPLPVGSIASAEQFLPTKLITLEAEAFKNAPFNSIHLGQDVESVGDSAFEGCPALFFVRVDRMDTAFGQNVFKGCPDSLVIICPKGSTAEAYAKANGIDFRNE